MAEKKKRIEELEKETQKPDFWEGKEKAIKISQELNELSKEVNELEKLEKELKELNTEEKIEEFKKKLRQKEFQVFLSGKHDRGPSTLQIIAGAGGQDAEDWVAMLQRMYERYCPNRGWKTKILHQHFGEPGGPEGRIGIKNVTIEIEGPFAYGFLKNETGVHRLVRISPFSGKSLRHTSFALVEVLPIIEIPKEIEIDPKDLKIDFYRASGPGGQYVNKRETAVRITHLPSKISVSCQSERLQGQNKERAMKLLLSKLLSIKEKETKTALKEIKGETISASWGNQIRSYVLHPYKLVKDLRTNIETPDVEAVLDGELDKFIEAEIKV
ncbi:MAG: peptide chain release factor 2 [Candidatus Nealsonbacteria bacterium CG23_combo_of_CG06-09_8_20_14_all_36_12]|uniref:Peptide chain release factor 2 n=1 Tax=Candidatus Nealsonbacteria bacterium CG23_combo_of_CG06-09_8_20_14_all_36_12 TaxID=1974718 RepID=A0A2G9Z0L5_9BACT|nr:MAG: peptide chain release factor 2 [Candidatus Nealsonbacteria bacterium CG23_combo_of_CG06-09_8_20_14_all_36_12]